MDFFTIIFAAFGLGAAVYLAFRYFKKTGSGHKAMKVNLLVLGLVFALCLIAPFAANAQNAGNNTISGETVYVENGEVLAAEKPAEQAAPAASDNNLGLGMIAVALSMGLAGIGGGIAVASAAPAAIGATSEDPAAFGKAMIFVALGEAIALYGLVVSIMILGKF